jgi:hypothetical protein
MDSFNFFNAMNKNVAVDTQPIDKNFDHDYLDIPPHSIDLTNIKSIIKDPKKASDFQTNSLIFIIRLRKQINITYNYFDISSSDVKKSIQNFILLINELINEINTNTNSTKYNKKYVFVFFLFFLYFMNFRLGQIFLYYVFFHLRETSDQLSNIFQKLIESSMTYSVVQLDNIVADLRTDHDDNIIVLPDTINGQIKHNEFTFPNFSFMETFVPALTDIMKDNKTATTPSSSRTPSTSSTTSSTSSTNKKIQDIVQKTNNAKKELDDAKQKLNDAKQKAEDAQKNYKYIINVQMPDANKKATEAKTAADNAKTRYNDVEGKQNIVSLPSSSLGPRTNLNAIAMELATAKHEVENAFKNTVKAQLRCQQVATDLLAAFQTKQTTSNDLINAQKSVQFATEAFQSISDMSQNAQKIMIDSKYTTNDTKINNNDINNLAKYLPMTNKIDVKTIINTMNELSLSIAKKYNQAALEEQSQTTKGGKQIYLVKSNSVKANAHLHKNKGRSIRRYRIHY